MPARPEAPRDAVEAAHLLARAGKHVHVASEGHQTCLKGTCNTLPMLPPPPPDAPTPPPGGTPRAYPAPLSVL